MAWHSMQNRLCASLSHSRQVKGASGRSVRTVATIGSGLYLDQEVSPTSYRLCRF